MTHRLAAGDAPRLTIDLGRWPTTGGSCNRPVPETAWVPCSRTTPTAWG